MSLSWQQACHDLACSRCEVACSEIGILPMCAALWRMVTRIEPEESSPSPEPAAFTTLISP